MDRPHLEHIDTAFRQLSFAFKLWNYLRERPINRDEFDIPLTIEDELSRIALPHDEFPTYDELIVAAENNISICFGAVAISLWEAIREKTNLNSGDLDPARSREENLAALSYMLRCCFAHGTARPTWSIRKAKYKTVYRVGNKNIDLSAILLDQPFDYGAIGGYETLWFLKDEALAHGML